jgi:hypothetical protein
MLPGSGRLPRGRIPITCLNCLLVWVLRALSKQHYVLRGQAGNGCLGPAGRFARSDPPAVVLRFNIQVSQRKRHSGGELSRRWSVPTSGARRSPEREVSMVRTDTGTTSARSGERRGRPALTKFAIQLSSAGQGVVRPPVRRAPAPQARRLTIRSSLFRAYPRFRGYRSGLKCAKF